MIYKTRTTVWKPPSSAINLWGRSGRGHCRKFSATFREISANFPQNFRTLSWRNKTHFLQFSAEFPQNFRKNPFASDPISVLLTSREPWVRGLGAFRDRIGRSLWEASSLGFQRYTLTAEHVQCPLQIASCTARSPPKMVGGVELRSKGGRGL